MTYGIAAFLSAFVGVLLIVFRGSLATARIRENAEWYGASMDERALARMRARIAFAGLYMLLMALLLAATWRGGIPVR